MKNIASSKVSIGFVLTLLVLIANAVVAYQSVNTISASNRSVTDSTQILLLLEQLLSTLKNVETGQREYLLTSNPRYLTAHRTDIAKIHTQLKSLVELESSETSANGSPEIAELPLRLIAWKRKIDRPLSELAATIDGRQSPRLTPALEAILSQQEQKSIEQIQNLTTALNRSERLLLDRLQANSRKSLADTRMALAIAGLLDLLLLAILYALVDRDAIAKQRAESTLRNDAAKFEELYHSAPCGYHSLDATGKIRRINRTELHMLGYEESEIIDRKNIVDLLTTTSVQKLTEQLAIIKTRGGVSDIELEMVRKDGRIVPVSVTAIGIKDAQQHYLGSRMTVIDISDRVRSRKQTQLSAEISQKIRQSLQLEEILQTAVTEVQKLLAVDRVVIFRFEADGAGTVVQEQVVAGFPQVLGSKINDPCFDRTYYHRYAQGRIYTVADITQAGFEPCYVEFLQQFAVKASSIVPIYLRSELWGLLIVHHCQSPRQWQPRELEILTQLATQIGIALAQAQLLAREQLQRQELARSNAELEQFAHITSHDLQEPLRMVISYLQLLSRRYQGKLDPDADEFIEYAVDGAVRMQSLIQALLSYARVSSRKQPFDRVDCNLVLQDAISNLYVAIIESSATILADPLPTVWGDATQLTQIFQNLIANAIKFRRDVPPQIRISVKPAATAGSLPHTDLALDREQLAATSAWCFAVADNGIGIESQYLDRIFVIFQRLHTRDVYPGTGIGLAICKKIIERHGGTMWVESTPERSNSVSQQPLSIQSDCCGSIFYFIIPAVDSTSPQHAHKQPHY
jgi:PAS domain S-box-containing protein